MPPIDLDRRHYQAILDRRTVDQDHPIDLMISRLPEIVEIDRTLREFALQMHDPGARTSQEQWIEYEDLRLLQRTARQERFFDVGFEFGRAAGMTESSFVANDEGVGELRDFLRDTILRAPLSREWATAVILEMARALVLAGSPAERKGTT
jgi:hypothetical protein